MPNLSDDIHIDLIPDLDIKVGELAEVIESTYPVAQAIAEVARSTAPVGDSGDYRDGIEAEHTRTGARVASNDFKSAWIEFGVPSNGVPAQFNLRRAAESLGLTFRKRR